MSDSNPYSPAQNVTGNDYGIRKVKIRPIELMKRGYALVGDQYGLFLGITLVGLLVGSAVPLGLIMGAMMVGIYMCYIHREQGIRVELSTVFKGFDYFKESLIAWLVLFAVSMIVMIPFMIAIFAVILGPIIANAGNPQQGPPPFPVALFAIYPLMIIANIVITLPFIFTFQLIVDRNLKAMAAIRLSIYGVRKNFWGVVWFMIVLTIVSFILVMMCYVPAILFLPISFGAMFLMYRDIFGPGIPFGGPSNLPQQASPSPQPSE